MIGRHLAHFRIDAKLGEGGMGVVYRATDERLRRDVALKVLPESRADDPERRRRFLREARAAAAVTHRNIAAVYDIGEAEGHVFIAMEFVRGTTLREHLGPGLTHVEALRIAREIAKALAHAHDSGVVHRDLKPENVMVTADGDIRVLDFGLAKLLTRESTEASDAHGATASQVTAEGQVMGTPAYMSPEQVAGRTEIDARTDVFSFGVLLYEMLAGRRPFEGETSVALLYAVLHREPEALEAVSPDVPAFVAAVVGRCLRKRMAERFGSGREVLRALDETVTPVAEFPAGRVTPVEKISTVSGMGTALGATLAPAAAALPDRAASPSAPRSRRRAWVGITTIALVALVGSALAFEEWRHQVTASTAPVAALEKPSSGVPMTAHPLPTSSNPEALVHYATALTKLRIGGMEAPQELQRAVALDPSLAAAQLRIVLYACALRARDRRVALARAEALESTLDPRDRAMLSVARLAASEPLAFDKIDAELLRLEAQSPEDAELPLLRECYARAGSNETVRAAAATRALALDPGATWVLHDESNAAWGDHDPERMLAAADRCLAQSPEASGCLRARTEADSLLGRCDSELDDARRLVLLEPTLFMSYGFLAQALQATHASRDTVAAAIVQAEQHLVPSASIPRGTGPLELALLDGDFTNADALAAELARAETSTVESSHVNLMLLRIALAQEMGLRTKALDLADAFEARLPTWTADAPDDVRLWRVYLRHEAGLLGDQDFAAARDRLVEEALRSTNLGTVKGDPVIAVNAKYAATSAEASFGLPADGGQALLGRLRPGERGRLLRLAGRPADALPDLRRAAASCEALSVVARFGLEGLEQTLDHVHWQLELGLALEATHDSAAACRAYAAVVDFWPAAKPRSVTVEAAKRQRTALGCKG